MYDRPEIEVGGRSAGSGNGQFWLAGIAVLAVAICACLVCLDRGPFLTDHEAINAQSARQTIESGRWLIPQVGEITRVRKTPLGIWSIAAASVAVDPVGEKPVTEFSARLAGGIAGVLNALAVFWLGTMLFGRRTGLVAGVIMGGCVATFFFGRNAQVDMLLTLFTTLCYACFWRGAMSERRSPLFMLLFYVALAAAMMAKAPMPMITVGFALAVYWFVTVPVVMANLEGGGSFVRDTLAEVWPQVRGLWRLWLIPGILLFIVLAGAWPYYIYKHVPNVLDLWKLEYLDRYSGSMSNKHLPFYYYIEIAFGLTVPFMLSLPEAVAAVFLKRYREHRAGLAFAFTWAIVGTVFLSTASYKRPHYLLSIIPAYCLLLAPVIERLFFGVIAARRWVVGAACAAVPIVLGVGFIVAARSMRREFPDLYGMYIIAAASLWGLWSLAAVFYAIGRRAVSFGLLSAWVLVMATVVWPGTGRAMRGEPEMIALVNGLQEHGIGRDQTLIWIEGRPNSTVEYYWGYRLRRLMDELEMSAVRENRADIGEDLLRTIAARVEKELARPEPVYMVLSIGNFELMQRETKVRARKVFELSGFKDKDEPGAELVVITQLSGATQPTIKKP